MMHCVWFVKPGTLHEKQTLWVSCVSQSLCVFQAEQDTESVFSVQSSISHRDQPAAIRSSLRLGVNHTFVPLRSTSGLPACLCRPFREIDKQLLAHVKHRRQRQLLLLRSEPHDATFALASLLTCTSICFGDDGTTTSEDVNLFISQTNDSTDRIR